MVTFGVLDSGRRSYGNVRKKLLYALFFTPYAYFNNFILTISIRVSLTPRISNS